MDGKSEPAFASPPDGVGTYDVAWRGYIADSSRAAPAEKFASAYERWQSELAAHVFGEFAVAIFDRASGSLFATHDGFGLVPLFYAEVEGELLVASHLETLVRNTGVRTLDEDFIADYLGEGWHLGARTPYAHIRRLLPGESLTCKNGRKTLRRSAPLPEEPVRLNGTAAYEERLRDLLTEAVTFSIPAGKRTWCELSGGLDSSTIFALAAGARTPELAAFSYIYSKSTRADERDWIRAVLERYPAPWYTLDVDSARPFTDLPNHWYAEPTTALLTGTREQRYHDLLRAHGVEVVLSGLGGDAVLHGNSPKPYHLADYFRRGDLSGGARQLRRWTELAEHKRPVMYWFLRTVLRPSMRHARREFIEYDWEEIPWINPAYAKRMKIRARGRHSHAMRRRSVAATYFMEGIMRGGYGASMRYREPTLKAQFRHPLLYRPLVEFMQRVPWDLQLDPEEDRILQRHALAGLLPQQTLERRTKGGPDQAFFSGLRESAEWRERLTREPRIVARGYADRGAWAQAVHDASIGKTFGVRYFLASASLEIWLQELENRPA